MGSFDASLKTLGDRTGLPATIQLRDGRLAIRAGDDPIGEWSLDEIRLEPIPSGYRMSAEGDQIFLELSDIEGFAAELSRRPGRRRRSQAKKATDGPGRTTRKSEKADARAARMEAKAQKRNSRAEAGMEKEADHTERARSDPEPVVRPAPIVRSEPRPLPNPASEPVTAYNDTATTTEDAETAKTKRSSLQRLDKMLAAAEDRWGSLLPEWMFTRIMLGVVVGSLLLMVALPGLVSTFLLIGGFLIVVFGAAIYTDPMLGAKWLPGRMSPSHVLVFGVAILMFGVLLGVIAN